MRIPKITIPAVKLPNIKVPDIHLPNIKIQDVNLLEIPKVIDNLLVKRVHPERGSVVYCNLLGIAEHSGIYIGHHKIVHLDGSGKVKIVTPEEFIRRMNGINPAINILVSCRHGKPVGSHDVAKRAKEMAGERRGYDPFNKNCHQFTAGCLTGKIHNNCNTFAALEHEVKATIHGHDWQLWKTIIPGS
jgi:hypothetical protein